MSDQRPDATLGQVTNRESAEADAAGIARLDDLVAMARDYARASKAVNTRRAYRHDWRDFAGWCERHRLQVLPAAPGTLCLYEAHGIPSASAAKPAPSRNPSASTRSKRSSASSCPPHVVTMGARDVDLSS